MTCTPVAPVAYQVILEPGIQVSFVSSNPPECIQYSYKFVGTFSCAQFDLRKAQERELATLDEKSTTKGLLNPMSEKKNEGKNRGGRRDDTYDHGLSGSWKLESEKCVFKTTTKNIIHRHKNAYIMLVLACIVFF